MAKEVDSVEGQEQEVESQEQEEKSYEDYFEEALGEGDTESEEQGTGSESTTQEDDDASTGDETEAGQEDEEKEGGSYFEPAPEQEEPAAQDGETDYKALYEKELQRTRSWEGRLSAKDKEIKDLQNQLQNLEQKIQSPSSDSSAQNVQSDQQQQDSSQAKGELDEFFKEYPELQKPLMTLVNNVVEEKTKQAIGQIEQRFGPVQESVQRQEAEQHKQAIYEAHSDVDSIVQSGQLEKWVEAQPDYISESMKRVIQEGSTEQVIDLLSRFKEATGFGKTAPAQKQEESASQKKKAAGAVPSHSPGPKQEGAKKDDYESAWREAIKEMK